MFKFVVSKILYCLRGNCTPNQNWACFVHYLKIVKTVLKNESTGSKLSEKKNPKKKPKQKKTTEILVGLAVLQILDQNNILHILLSYEPLNVLKY